MPIPNPMNLGLDVNRIPSQGYNPAAGMQPPMIPDFSPNPVDPQTGQPPGIAAFGEILRARAAQGGEQFNNLLIGGDRFAGNQVAQQFLNQGLGERGLEYANGQIAPQTGLIGATGTLERGEQEGIDTIRQAEDLQRTDIIGGTGTAIDFMGGGRDLAVQALQPGQENFQQFTDTGLSANTLKADLAGVNGPEAQARAYREFQESPGQDWLRGRGDKAIAAAAGRFGDFGPNMFKDLDRFRQGLALQDLGRVTGEIGEVAGRGMQGAQGVAQLGTVQAGIESDFGYNAAQAELGKASQLANISGAAGVNVTNLIQQAARDIASGQYSAGESIARNIEDTFSSVAGLQGKQGEQLSNLLGAGASTITDILVKSGLTAAEQQQMLAAILSDLSTGNATSGATLSYAAGNASALGKLGESEAYRDTVGNIFTALEGMDFGGGGGGATISGSAGQMVA